MGSLFNINNVLVSESAIYSNTALENLTETTYKKSFMSMAYDYITESTIFYDNLNKKFYKTVLESQGDFYIINEAFEGFIDKVKEIIKKFLEFIKRVFNEFIARLNGMFKSEKYLKKNMKEFNKFTSDHEFDMEVYEFSNIRENKPDIQVYQLVLGTGADIPTVKGGTISHADSSGDSAHAKIKAAYDDLKDGLNEDYYDKVRGALIGNTNGVSAGDFPDELFAYFRNNDMDKTNTTITSAYVLDAKTKFLGYENLKKSIERTKKDIEREYEDTRKALERMMSTSGKDIKLASSNAIAVQVMGIMDTDNGKKVYGDADYTYDSDEYTGADRAEQQIKTATPQQTRTLIDSYLKAKVSQVQALSNIHSQVFSAKLEAAKDEFNQNKAVLYRALYKITGKQKKL